MGRATSPGPTAASDPTFLPDAGEEKPQSDRDDRLRRRPRGVCEEREGGFHLAVSYYT